MRAIQLAISSLHIRRNAYLPVSRLPPEMLAKIFQFLVLLDLEWTREGLGWIAVTHVCASWRAIALGCPSLWTNLTFRLGMEWAETMLGRSRGLPLA
ncbi:hypothetical protein FA95DRAFT_1472499, partial [Auriscalpium vulgare]